MQLTNLFRRWDRAEDGTAMTEFVITLPIFVLIFAFMASLHDYQVTLNRVRYRAATNMWEEAMKVQSDGAASPTSPHGLPPSASGDAVGIIGGSTSFAGDTQQQAVMGAMAGGSGPEMVAGANAIGGGGSDPADETSLTFAESIAEDPAFGLPSPENDAVNVFMFAVARTAPMTRHAGIIGTRYGMVEGSDSDTADAGNWGTSQMDAAYDVLVSPVSIPSDDEGFVVGASRVLADDDPCLQTVLELSTSMSDC